MWCSDIKGVWNSFHINAVRISACWCPPACTAPAPLTHVGLIYKFLTLKQMFRFLETNSHLILKPLCLNYSFWCQPCQKKLGALVLPKYIPLNQEKQGMWQWTLQDGVRLTQVCWCPAVHVKVVYIQCCSPNCSLIVWPSLRSKVMGAFTSLTFAKID